MDWKRFKKIIIIVLIMINIVFLIYFINIKLSDNRVEEKTRNNVISILENNNIILESDRFPENPEKCSACYVTRLIDTESEFAERLKGKGGKISEKDELFVIEPYEKGSFSSEEKEIERICMEYMEEHGIEFEMYKKEKAEINSGNAKIKYNLYYDECLFFDSFLEFELTKQGIKKVTGKNIIRHNSVNVYEEKLMPAESIIVTVPEHKKTEKKIKITGIDFGYYFGKSAGVYINVLSLPVWKISFEDGTYLYYDARNGNLINFS